LKSAFRKISRVPGMGGGTKWYLSEDCLLSAKRMMYTVEYRRFYLRDLESVVVWPNPLWLSRVIIPAVVLAGVGASLWEWANAVAGAILGGLALAWAVLELALGPTARSRIRTTGASVDLALVKRTRRARKVLAQIDEAVRATRETVEPLTEPAAFVRTDASSRSDVEVRSTSGLIADATETNGS
jgi:hypothetical protein